MASIVDRAWNDMRDADMMQTRMHGSRLNETLDRSKKQSRSKEAHPSRNRIPSNQRSTAGRPSMLEQGYDIDPSKHLEKATDGCNISLSCVHANLASETRPVDVVANKLLSGWQKNKNGASDRDVSIRKVAMRGLARDLCAVVEHFCDTLAPTQGAPSADVPPSATSFLEDLMSLLMSDLAKTLFKGLADPAEPCRESSIRAVTVFVEHVSDMTPYLAYLYPCLMARAVPAGNSYDPELELFVHDGDEHEAYKRGKATERQDQHVLLIQAVPEESEELRLSLCRLVGRMLNHLMGKGTIGVLRPYFDDTVLLLAAQCRDSYSAVKEEALVMITKLALHPHLEQGMKFYAVGLARAIMPYLRHRHAKVRLAAVEALWMIVKVPDRAKVKGAGTSAIVDLVGFREDNVLPVAAFYGRGDRSVNHLAELTTDRNVSVRVKTTAMLGDWLTSLPDRYDHQTRLLPYILNAIADEAKAVSAIAIETLARCGAEYEREHQDDVIERRQFGVDGDVRANHSKPLPRPFLERPRIGSRLYVRCNSRRFLLPLLTELSNWISRTRLQSATLLRTLIVYCEEHLIVETHKLVPHLQRALHLAATAKDEGLKGVLLECCELLGRYVTPESYLPHMLSRIREEPEVNPTGNRANLLVILSKLMEGATSKVLIAQTSDIVEAVTERREDIAGEGMEMRGATIKVLLVVATCMSSYGKVAAEGASFAEKGRLTSLERPIRLMIAYLLACSVLGDSPTDIEQCFISLAIGSDVENAEVLVTTYAGKIVEDMSECYPIGPAWSRTCFPQLTLKGLLSMCPEAPSTCPQMLKRLLSLCQQVLDKLENIPENSRELVLTALVGVIVRRSLQVWRYRENDTSPTMNAYNAAMGVYACSLMDLSLHASWDGTPSLRRHQLETCVMFTRNKVWQIFLSTTPPQAVATTTNVMAMALRFLECSQSSPEDRSMALAMVSRVLRTSGFTRPEPNTSYPSLTPFSRRGSVSFTSSCSDASTCSVIADAYPLVLARVEDSNEDVRHRALETMGEFLPFVQPDVVGSATSFLGKDGELGGGRHVIEGEAAIASDIRRPRILFEDFVEKCAAVARTTATSLECVLDLDFLLRRAACLDPEAFTSVMSRALKNPSTTETGRQLLAGLCDHASVLVTFEGQ